MLPDGLLPGRSATDRFTFECPFVGMLKVIEEPARSAERSGRRQVVRTSQHLVYLSNHLTSWLPCMDKPNT